jgi:glutaredoxin 3
MRCHHQVFIFDAKYFDIVDDGRALHSALQEITYQTTVPNIFIGRKHIGGNSEIQDIKEQLPELLRHAGAL